MKNPKRIISFAVIAMLFIASVFYSFPRVLDKEYNGIMYRLGDSNYSEIVKIKIDGYYSKGLLSQDMFKGSIIIGDKELSRIDMTFDKFGMGLLFSYYEGEYRSYGSLHLSKNKNELTICVFEEGLEKGGKSWSANDGLMISAPASNREEAVEITKVLMKDIWKIEE